MISTLFVGKKRASVCLFTIISAILCAFYFIFSFPSTPVLASTEFAPQKEEPITFIEHSFPGTTPGWKYVHAADIDDDGDMDILSAGGVYQNDKVAWYENVNGDGTVWTEYTISSSNSNESTVYAADMDNDGDLDVISTSIDDKKVTWYENNGGTPLTFTNHTIYSDAAGADGVYAIDLTQDDRIDVISASAYDDKVTWYENDGASSPAFTTHIVTTTADFARSVYAIDLDGDGDNDILSASRDDNKIAWYENDGEISPSFTSHIVTTDLDYVYTVHASDLDNDLDVDIVSASTNDGTVVWFENNGDSNPSFTSQLVTTDTTQANWVHTVDMDRDADVDILVLYDSRNTIAWYENDGGSPPNFVAHIIATTTTGSSKNVYPEDIDGDGDFDVVFTKDEYNVVWYEQEGSPYDCWQEVGTGSASSEGISNNIGESMNPASAVASDGTLYITWDDDSSGNKEIYVLRWNGTNWEEVGNGSASGGGISNSSGESSYPSIAIAPDDTPYIVWRDNVSGSFQIYVRRWNGSSWEEVETGSASGGGVSGTSCHSTSVGNKIAIDTTGTPYIVWDEDCGSPEVYVKKWDGIQWVEPVAGSASGGGISNTSGKYSYEPSIAIGADNIPYVVWHDNGVGYDDSDIYIRRLDNGAWEEVGTGSASGAGIISPPANGSSRARVAIASDGTPYVTWRETISGTRQIYVRRWNGSNWEETNDGSATGGGISNSDGWSWIPSIAIAPGDIPYISWHDHSDGDREIYTRRLNDITWEEIGDSSAHNGGISDNDGDSYWSSVAVAPNGTAYVAWGDDSSGNWEIYVKESGSCVVPPPGTSLVAAADSADLYPGDTTSVVLNIEDADDLYAAQALCTVDPIILEPQSAIFGDFFDLVNRFIAANTVDAGAGTWFGAISQQNPAGPLSGNGHFATVTYQALSPGTSTVTCEPLFSDRDGFTQTVTFVTDTVMVLPFATITGTATYQGRLDHAGIAVAASGAVTSTDTTDSAGNFSLGALRAYTYTVRADVGSYLPACSTVSVTPGETATLPTTTLLGGDLNDDDTINIADATLLGSNFGLSVPPAAAQADINADSIVNVQDLAILAGNYDVTGCQSW